MLSTTQANNNKTLRESISHPGNIPNFYDYETPTITPGSSGVLKFTIQNRYNLSHYYDNNNNYDNNMINVTLVVDIYQYSTLEKQKSIDDISNAPEIVGSSPNFQELSNDRLTVQFYWSRIINDTSVPIEIKFKSSSDTPEGRYFIRMHLKFSFTFNDTYFNMKSRGYFSDSMWDRASMNITDQEGQIGDRFIAGRLDLNELGVDGVIPETSIRVLSYLPTWPLYILIGVVILFIVLAIIFYLMDEKGWFPKTKQKLDKMGKKIEDFRYRRK
jgi:hypothetical protein